MKQLFKKWWFWVIIVVVIIALLPIWCKTIYLPDQATQTVIEEVRCGSIFNLFAVY